jgi:hypothetical protein
MANHWDLKLVQCFIIIRSGQEDPIIFLWDMVDQRGLEDLKYLVFTYPFRYQSGDLKLCTFSLIFHLEMCILSGRWGSNHELWWIQEGWRVCNSWCLLLDGQLESFQTLFNALLSFVDVCIARMGRSSNISEFWWIHRGVGCEITSAHFSS